MKTADVIVIGAGLVGVSIAWGVVRSGHKVILLDEGDVAFRASRGNFGLVWVQGKGLVRPDGARWIKAKRVICAGFHGRCAVLNSANAKMWTVRLEVWDRHAPSSPYPQPAADLIEVMVLSRVCHQGYKLQEQSVPR